MPSYPLADDHFQGGANLTRGSISTSGGDLATIINDLDGRSSDSDDAIAALGVRTTTAEADIDGAQAAIVVLQGGVSTPATLAATGALPAGQVVILDTSGGAVTATLPAAASSIGREVFITRAGASAGQIDRAGSDTIGAAGTSYTLAADGDSVTLVCISSTRWAIKANQTA